MQQLHEKAEAFLPEVYDELRRLAAFKLANERKGQTLSATSLVHEAYLLLTRKGDRALWQSKGHFFAAAAISMRRILREKALRKKRIRHGGQFKRSDFEKITLAIELEHNDWCNAYLDLDDALDELRDERPNAAELVNLRFFCGLSVAESASVLGVSERTADRYWVFAKAWLYRFLNEKKT